MNHSTPRPWKTATCTGNDRCRLVTAKNPNGGDPLLIADCYPDSGGDFSLPDRKEYQTNAQLIVQAVALADQIARLLLYDEEFEPSECSDAPATLDNLIAQARKITGYAPAKEDHVDVQS